MEDYIQFPEYSKEDLDRAFEEADEAVEKLHNKLALAAEEVGYVKNIIILNKPTYDDLYKRAQDDPSVYPTVASGIEFLMAMSNEVHQLAGTANEFTNSFSLITSSTGTFGNASSTAAFVLDLGEEEQLIPPPPNRKSRDYYSNKLNELDPTLANTYNQVWQTLLGTSSEPHRASLFMMRTLFDNFFAKIAPDNEVRNSRFWQRKEGDKPNQIWRSERITYALEKNIKDANRRAILEAETKQISTLYKAANTAHDRGSLDEEKASRTLIAMDNFLRDWIDSLN